MERNILKIGLLIGICSVCCNYKSNGRIEKAINNYMLSEVNDPSKYEPLSFETDTVLMKFQDTEEYKILKGLANVATDKNMRVSLHLNSYESMDMRYFGHIYDSLLIVKAVCNEINSKLHKYIWNKGLSFDSTENSKRTIEYKVLHKFRATNSKGVLINAAHLFFIDTTFKIVNVIENPGITEGGQNSQMKQMQDLHTSEVNESKRKFNLPTDK